MPDEIIASCDVVCGADENDVVCLPSLTILNSLRLTLKLEFLQISLREKRGRKNIWVYSADWAQVVRRLNE